MVLSNHLPLSTSTQQGASTQQVEAIKVNINTNERAKMSISKISLKTRLRVYLTF
jgi:hypothetical protein